MIWSNCYPQESGVGERIPPNPLLVGISKTGRHPHLPIVLYVILLLFLTPMIELVLRT